MGGMGQRITCICNYRSALWRGEQYEVLVHDTAKRQVRVRGSNARTRWFSEGFFDFDNGPVVSLVSWRFDDPVVDPENGRDATFNWVDAVMTMSDGTYRWCGLTTPDYLKHLLEPQPVGGEEPGIAATMMLVMRDLETATVDKMLRSLDGQNKLFAHSGLCGDDPLYDPDDAPDGE